MNFVALDVETSNADMASLCQIGLVKYENGILLSEWETLLNPEDYFDEVNVSIHGITAEHVKDSPKFPEIIDEFYDYLKNYTVVCHTHFDRVAIRQVFEKYDLEQPEFTWLDTARVARRTWEAFAWRGYGLENISRFLGYQYQAHDALEDAKACANLLLKAIETTGLDLSGWLDRVEKPILSDGRAKESLKISFKGNPDGPLFGDVIAFTGALTLPRVQAAKIASKIGCEVKNGVTKETTILVVGDQDIKKLSGHNKSSKHRKAESLIKQGYDIRILCETDFEELVQLLPSEEKDRITNPINIDNSESNTIKSDQNESIIDSEHLKFFLIVKRILSNRNKCLDYLRCTYTGDFFDINNFYTLLRIKLNGRKKYILVYNTEEVIKTYWHDAVCSPGFKNQRGWTRINFESAEDINHLEEMIITDFDKTMESIEVYKKHVNSAEKKIKEYLKKNPPP